MSNINVSSNLKNEILDNIDTRKWICVSEDESVKEVVTEETDKKETPKVEFNVNNISREKLTPQYVDKLLKRITELEEDSSSANREEILLLNAELDYILSVLRKQ